MGRIAGLDHLAITADDPEATMAFYRDVLGAEIIYEDEWRSGKFPIFMMQVGSNRINVHDEVRDRDLPKELVARVPTPGSGDFCFRWEGPIEDAVSLLETHGVAVTIGPVHRDASNGEMGTSVYFNDPDGNLLEFLTLD